MASPEIRTRLPRNLLLCGIAGFLLMGSPCGPLPMKAPVTVPADPPAGSGYRRDGKRLTFEVPAFAVSAEPMDDAAVKAFFRERAKLDMNPFQLPRKLPLPIFRVTIVNKTDKDIAFHAVYATLRMKERASYHMSPAEVYEELADIYPEVDLIPALSKTLFDASTVVNPKAFVTRLLVYDPLHEDVRQITLEVDQIGPTGKGADLTFPFEVVEMGDWSGGATPKEILPAGLKEQRD